MYQILLTHEIKGENGQVKRLGHLLPTEMSYLKHFRLHNMSLIQRIRELVPKLDNDTVYQCAIMKFSRKDYNEP